MGGRWAWVVVCGLGACADQGGVSGEAEVAETVSDSDSDSGSETMSGSDSGSDSGSITVTDSGSGSDSGSDSGADSGSDSVPDALEVGPETSTPWTSDLHVERVSAASIAGVAYASAGSLAVRWTLPASSVAGFRVRAREGELTGRIDAEVVTDGATREVVLGGLDASTHYLVTLEACLDAACAATVAPVDPPAAGDTAEQVWQFRGTGASTSGLTHIVSDGNVRIHAVRFGDDAPADVAGHVQLYYGPMPPTKGLTIATSAAAATADPTTFDAFVSHALTAGIRTPTTATTLIKEINTAQAVPLASALGGGVRLYFEANGTDGHARILHIDSADGWTGLDFNHGAGTVCQTATDYGAGGDCAPTVDLGVAGDAVLASAKLKNVRQFKIGVRTRDDWRWDGAVGTFMVVTTDSVDGCATDGHNQAYAVWDGTRWNVQYRADGCPKLLTQMQAATPLHLGMAAAGATGGDRFALYYGDTSDLSARPAGAHLPFLGPKKLRYAHAATAGDPAVVEFEDWETAAESHGLTFLWPSGAALDAVAEGFIDDFVALLPTDDPALEVLYVAITDGSAPPFAAVAVLVNP